jgi:hypothetical protein
VTKG